MKKISVFNHISVDGFFAGPNGEIDWFKAIEPDEEWNKFTHTQATSESTLIFGRTTYDMMKSYWPTEIAIQNDPGMANVMNNSTKIVFSKKLKTIEETNNWKNITLLREINPEEFTKLKMKSDMTILGSGSIVQQLTNLGLIEEYYLVVVPVILGKGKPLFNNVKESNLNLVNAKTFNNGIVFLTYKFKI